MTTDIPEFGVIVTKVNDGPTDMPTFAMVEARDLVEACGLVPLMWADDVVSVTVMTVTDALSTIGQVERLFWCESCEAAHVYPPEEPPT